MGDVSAAAPGVSQVSGRRGAFLGVALVAFAELWERASYYSIVALIALFAIASAKDGGLGLTNADAIEISGDYTLMAFGLTGYLWTHRRPVRRALPSGRSRCDGHRLRSCHALLRRSHQPDDILDSAVVDCYRNRATQARDAVPCEFVLRTRSNAP